VYGHILCRGFGTPGEYVFLQAYKIKSQTVFQLLSWLVKQKINVKFLLASLKTLYRLFRKPHHISVSAFLNFHWLISPVNFHGRISQSFSESQATFGTTVRVTDGFQKAKKNP
jgi:hypothetical protein